MWNDIPILTQMGAWAKWIAAISALVAAAFSVRLILVERRLKTQELIPKKTPLVLDAIVSLRQRRSRTKWIAAILWLVAAIFGGVAILTDRRIESLNLVLKKTPPQLRVELRAYEHGKFFLHVESLNFIPFECNYMLLNRFNESLTGIPIEWVKVYPTKEEPDAQHEPHLDLSKVPDGYVKLKFDYRSIHYEELRIPELAGTIEIEYDISKGYPIRLGGNR